MISIIIQRKHTGLNYLEPVLDKEQTEVSYRLKKQDSIEQRPPRRINLKSDYKWKEVANFQKFVRMCDLWEGFPIPGVKLVDVEFRCREDTLQRIDMLYINSGGAIFPCELKIGGEARHVHGQLISYLADLSEENTRNKIGIDYVLRRRQRFIAEREKWTSTYWTQVLQNRKEEVSDDKLKKLVAQNVPIAHTRHMFNDFIERINPSNIHLESKSGIIIDEGFSQAVVDSARYSNSMLGLNITLIEAKAYTTNEWNINDLEYNIQVDFEVVSV